MDNVNEYMDGQDNKSGRKIKENLMGDSKILDSVYVDLFKKLKNGDLDSIIRKTGGELIESQKLGIKFFYRDVIVDLETEKIYYKGKETDVRVKNQKELDVLSSSIILHYLTNADGTEISGKWISYRELPGGMFYFRTIPGVLQPVLEKYKNSSPDFIKKVEELGGKRSNEFNNGAVIYPFDRFPVLILLDEECEEFEASVRVLFDKNSSHYIKTDVVKMLTVYIVKALVNLK